MGKKRVKAKQRVGQRFGHLLVRSVELREAQHDNRKNKAGHSVSCSYAVCLCDCGNIVDTKVGALVTGNTISCGCASVSRAKLLGYKNRTHGHSTYTNPDGSPIEVKCTKTYRAWAAMRSRCSNARSKCYRHYGGRGIKVCDRWLNSFENFLEDMGEQPQGRSLDRIDNEKGYSKDNCRWATWHEQARNKRSNKLFTINGVTKSMVEWVEAYGNIKYTTVKQRVRFGWGIEEALNTPIDQSCFSKTYQEKFAVLESKIFSKTVLEGNS